MNDKDRQTLYKLFRDQSDVLGSSQLTVTALQAFVSALKVLKCSREEIFPLFEELIDIISHSQPHIVSLIHLLEEFPAEIRPLAARDSATIRAEAVRILEAKIAKFEECQRRVVEQGMSTVVDGDVLLVHSVSSVVRAILLRAHQEKGRRFQVIVLEQDFNKTRQLLKSLDRAAIPYKVMPEYTLSHAIREATKFFLTAHSVTADRNLVADAGTANIVSLCHVEKIPIYLFVNSLKFSHQATVDQRIHRKEVRRIRDGHCYHVTTYSHCLVAIGLIDHVFTEAGELDRTQVLHDHAFALSPAL
ncbi:MAG: hypothetical protein M0009_15760 [Deltaproteobacteria bacterium]|nr:hypothetical protein [Deltaproteobacteria bacterium]